MKNSKIEWTDNTENIIRIKGSRAYYCTKVSPGCKNCYAETMSRRLAAMGHDAVTYEYKVMKEPPALELRRDILADWAKRKHSQKLFVSSMTDVFGEFVPDEWVFEMLDAMIEATLQTFQVLTKRAGRMRELVNAYCDREGFAQLPAHIWLMVSVENQQYADERIPELLATQCSVRGLSVEPLLGSVDLMISNGGAMPEIDWVIVGGESGYGARPIHPEWVRGLRDQCKENDIAFFFKQWGEWVPWEEDAQPPFFNSQDGRCMDGHLLPSAEEFEGSKKWNDGMDYIQAAATPCLFERVGKSKAGNELDGVVYQEFP